MGKSDVVLKFDADTARAVLAILEATKALNSGADAARKFGEETKHAGEHAHEFGEKVRETSKELIGMIGIPLTIAAGAEKAFELVNKAMEESTKRGEEFAQRIITIQQALASTGQMSQLPKVTAGVAKIASETDRPQAMVESFFAAIHNAGGGRTTPKGDFGPEFAGTSAAMQATRGNMSGANATSLGAGVANLMTLMPGLGAEAAGNLALFLQTNAPGLLSDEKMLGEIARAKDPMATAKILAAGYQGFQPGKKLIGVAAELDKTYTPEEMSHLSPVERRHARNIAAARASGEDIWAAVGARPEDFLSAEQRPNMMAIMAGRSRLRDPGSLKNFVNTAVMSEGSGGAGKRFKDRSQEMSAEAAEATGSNAFFRDLLAERVKAEMDVRQKDGWFPELRKAFRVVSPAWFSNVGRQTSRFIGESLGAFPEQGYDDSGTNGTVLRMMEEQNKIAREHAEEVRKSREAHEEGNELNRASGGSAATSLSNDKPGNERH